MLRGLPRPVLLAVEVVVLVLLVVSGLAIRVAPWYRVWGLLDTVRADAPSVWKYGFLHANDPWIEYWMAEKLHEKGVGYWFKLKPDVDPDTRLFWYPWGRDFTHTSYPLVPALIAATYPGGMPLTAWAALIPPLAGAVMIVVGYVIGRRLAGPLAGLSVAALLAFLPAAIDRTIAGFIEKEGVCMPVLLGFLALLLEALREERLVRALAYSVASGILGGVLAWGWGGYQLVPVTLAALAILSPAFIEYEKRRKVYALLAITVAASTLVATGSPRIISGRYLLVYAGALGACLLGLLAAEASYRIARGRSSWRLVALGFSVLLLALAVAATALRLLPISGRAVYALLWPLRSGMRFGPLVESVAEHKMPSLAELSSGLGVLIVLGPLACLVGLYYAWTRRRLDALTLSVLGLAGLDAVIGMAYFMQLGGSLLAVSTALLYLPFTGAGLAAYARARRRGRAAGAAPWRTFLVALVALLVACTCAAYAVHDARVYGSMLPSILTAGTGLGYNPAWLKLLDELGKTPEDTVVVTWWDYGYWITVGAHRATLADGATLNATQIATLARILMSDEDTSTRLMRSLGLKPGKTIVVAYDLLIVARQGNRTLAFYPIPGLVDVRKSYWMVRIGGLNLTDYFSYKNVNVGGRVVKVLVPDLAKESARKALLYRMLVDAAYHLHEKGVAIVEPPLSKKPDLVYFMGTPVPESPLEHFKPWRVIAYKVPSLSTAQATAYIIVVAYKWTG